MEFEYLRWSVSVQGVCTAVVKTDHQYLRRNIRNRNGAGQKARTHLLFFQHVGLAQDLHGVHVTRVFLLDQTHLNIRDTRVMSLRKC